MKGKTVLLTGATAGIGKEAALQFAKRGATLICVGRNEEKTRTLVDELKAATGNEAVSYLIGDLSRPAEVKNVAAAFLKDHDKLDVLFNNAGAWFTDRQLTDDGLERTFALNHVGYFVLTNLLVDALKAGAPARVVSTSSDAHGSGDLSYLDDLQTEEWKTQGFKAYGRSKLANIWFTVELAKRLEGTGVTAHCFHPGFVASEFGRNNGVLTKIAMTLSRPFQKSVQQGADTGVWLATSDDVDGVSGGYWFERRRKKGTRHARDADAPGRLWKETERIVADVLGEDWASP
jgi:NAD(P)-dependent dehydrogenase (short-subunit alcohol dehydrogenase family)